MAPAVTLVDACLRYALPADYPYPCAQVLEKVFLLYGFIQELKRVLYLIDKVPVDFTKSSIFKFLQNTIKNDYDMVFYSQFR